MPQKIRKKHSLMHVYVYQYTHMLAKPVFSFSGRLSCGIQTVCHFKIVFLTWGWSCPVSVHQTMSRCLQVVQDRKICPKVFKIHLHWFKCNLLCICLLPYFRFANLHKTQLLAFTQSFLVLHRPFSWAWFSCTLSKKEPTESLYKPLRPAHVLCGKGDQWWPGTYI